MKKVLNNKGVSNLTSTLVGLLSLTIMLVISITFITVVNVQTSLNEFGNQMIISCQNYGKTDGNEIDARYEQLENTLNISPTVTYSATYFNSIDKTVQYGDLITITLVLEYDINLLGFDETLQFEIVKTGLSEVYWK